MIPLVKPAGGKRAVTSTVSEETERPLRADARRNRERILQSARAAFAESGSDAQIDDVARHAGVGVGTVYRHFPTKQALLTELVRQTFRLFTERTRPARGDDPSRHRGDRHRDADLRRGQRDEPEARLRLAQAPRSGDRHAQGALKRGAIPRVRADRPS